VDDSSAPDEPVRYLDRFASAEVRGWLSLPSSSARDFAVAYAMGWYLPPGGARRRLGFREVAVASLITKGRRVVIMDVLRIERRFWRDRVSQWVKVNMAHRCGKDEVVLYRRAEATCPLCGSLTASSSPLLAEALSSPELSTEPTEIVPQNDGNRAAQTAGSTSFSEPEDRWQCDCGTWNPPGQPCWSPGRHRGVRENSTTELVADA